MLRCMAIRRVALVQAERLSEESAVGGHGGLLPGSLCEWRDEH